MVTLVCDSVRFENIKAVIFDKDGTLENSRNFLIKLAQARSQIISAQFPAINQELLKLFGVQDQSLNSTGLMAVGSRKENEIVAAALVTTQGVSWFEARKIVESAFQQADQTITRNSQNAPLFPGCLDLIEFLSSVGVKLAIVSADSTARVDKFIQDFGLSAYFQSGLGAEYGTKPDSVLLIQACRHLGVEPQQTVVIGDAQGDISMALAGGAKGAIAINWTNENLRIQGADIVINDFKRIKILSD